MDRKAGYYWVKPFEESDWTVAVYCGIGVKFYIIQHMQVIPIEPFKINESRIPSPEEIDEDSFLIKMAKKFTSNSDIDFSQGDEKAIEQLKKKYGI